MLNRFIVGGVVNLRMILGETWVPTCPSNEDKNQFDEHCALSRWVLDKAVKHYMIACWRLRAAFVGDIQVQHGRVIVKQSDESAKDVMQTQDVCGFSPLNGNMRHYWIKWMPNMRRARQWQSVAEKDPRTMRCGVGKNLACSTNGRIACTV